MPHGAPSGWPSIVPRLFAGEPRQLAEFLVRVFGASGEVQIDRPTELQIGDSRILLSDDRARPDTTAFLYHYVADVDATYARAMQAGAVSLVSEQGEVQLLACQNRDRSNYWMS